MKDVMIDLLVMLLAIYIGLIASVIVPYKRKKIEDKVKKFDLKYLWHAVVTASWEFITGLVLYLGWNPPSGLLFSDIAILIVAFAFGYGGLEGQKQAEKILRLVLGRLQDPGVREPV